MFDPFIMSIGKTSAKNLEPDSGTKTIIITILSPKIDRPESSVGGESTSELGDPGSSLGGII